MQKPLYVYAIMVYTMFYMLFDEKQNLDRYTTYSRRRLGDVRHKERWNTEEFNVDKIIAAVNKSAARILYEFSTDEIAFICQFAYDRAESLKKGGITIQEMHNIVEGALERVNPAVAKSYRDYRNYKLDFIHMMDEVYTKSQSIRYIGDKSNANTDSALVATKRSLIFNELNKELYRKFFMTRDELQACKDGYIYIHDQSSATGYYELLSV